MIVGCPKEIKNKEHRVALIPASAKALVSSGHTVLMEKNAGAGCGILDQHYLDVGAKIVNSPKEVWQKSDMIVKVKEPLKPEFNLMRPGQTIFTFLHLAAEPSLTQALLTQKIIAVGYETITVNNALPVLKPMSEVAGRMAIQVGAWCLEKHQGGKGVLLAGVPGVKPAKVSIIGSGVVGYNAAKIACGIGADVTVLDTNLDRLEYVDQIFNGQVQTLYSTGHNIAQAVSRSDLVVGAVLVRGGLAPKLVTREMLANMGAGSVIVDVAVDQGGCVETMHQTTHDEPTFVANGVVHYGVANIPGAVARTSTLALAHASLPYLLQLADLGALKACSKNPCLAEGMNTYAGHVTYEAVASALKLPFKSLKELI